MALKKICIDPGHGGTQDYNVSGGLYEHIWNLDFAKKLKTMLIATGQFDVKLTREADETLDLTRRAEIARDFNSDMLLSVHSNAVDTSTVRGTYVIHSIKQPIQSFAESLSQAVATAYDTESNGASTKESINYPGQDYYTIIEKGVEFGIPAVLILERAFHTNPEDRANLMNLEMIDAGVEAVKNEILTYYGLTDNANQSTTSDLEQWKATAIVQDLAVMATTIETEGENSPLNRIVCNVIVDEFLVDKDGELMQYSIPETTFETSLSYYEAAMQIVNQLGNVTFKCDRFGDINLLTESEPSIHDEPQWDITDYVDLTALTYSEDILDLRNRIIIYSSYGVAMFEHKMITYDLMKGVNRTTSIEVAWADTLDKKQESARSFFNQMLANHKKMTIAIRGNPLIDNKQLVRITDKHTGNRFIYQIREHSHAFNESSFVTQLELNYVADVDFDQVVFITDNFPQYSKDFKYRLPLNKNPNSISLVLDEPIKRVVVKVKSNGNTLAEIDVTGNTYTNSYKGGE